MKELIQSLKNQMRTILLGGELLPQTDKNLLLKIFLLLLVLDRLNQGDLPILKTQMLLWKTEFLMQCNLKKGMRIKM